MPQHQEILRCLQRTQSTSIQFRNATAASHKCLNVLQGGLVAPSTPEPDDAANEPTEQQSTAGTGVDGSEPKPTKAEAGNQASDCCSLWISRQMYSLQVIQTFMHLNKTVRLLVHHQPMAKSYWVRKVLMLVNNIILLNAKWP